MNARVEVLRRRYVGALAVPRGAIVWEGAKTYVTLPGGAQSGVRLETCTPTECVVAAGLTEGQRVAL